MDSSTTIDSFVSGLRERGISTGQTSVALVTAAIVASESLLYFGFTTQALWAHLITLFGCAVAPLVLDDEGGLFQAFALVPLFRLVNLGMPVFVELTIYWFPLIYGALFPAIYLIGRSRNPELTLGWKMAAKWLLPGLAVSFLLAYVEYAIITPSTLIPDASLMNLLVIGVVMIGFVGFVEELLFRGVLQRVVERHIGQWPGLLLTSAIFGLMHSGYGVPGEIVFAGAIGFVFGWVYDRTDSLVLISVMHGVLNMFLFAIIPLYEPLGLVS